MARVCHISTVHHFLDNRVFRKECQSLARAGHDVIWVVRHAQDEVLEGVQILALPNAPSRIYRWAFLGWLAFRIALRCQADIYHVHDPELLPQGLLLRLLGKCVIYDIHEDYVSSISQKEYLPWSLRSVIAWLFGTAEVAFSRPLHQIIAERYYSERFPRAIPVLNYPVLSNREYYRCQRSPTALLYTGKVHLARGAQIHASIPGFVPNTTVQFIGKCAVDLHERLLAENADHWDKLQFEGVGRAVAFSKIERAYQGRWLAGLAIFPPNEHLDRKELTKFFEYMKFGLPIIASNFPVWRELIEQSRCGICVDPLDQSSIYDAITQLQNDEQLWRELSENGIKTVRQRYAWSSQERILLDLYERLSPVARQ